MVSKTKIRAIVDKMDKIVEQLSRKSTNNSHLAAWYYLERYNEKAKCFFIKMWKEYVPEDEEEDERFLQPCLESRTIEKLNEIVEEHDLRFLAVDAEYKHPYTGSEVTMWFVQVCEK